MPPAPAPEEKSAAADADDLARVRLVLMRELETISQYEQLARDASSPRLRDFFLHLAREEKEHVAEATVLLRSLDPDQDAHFQKPYPAEHFAGAPHPPAPPARPPAPQLQDLRVPPDPRKVLFSLPAPEFPNHTLTVGALKRRDR